MLGEWLRDVTRPLRQSIAERLDHRQRLDHQLTPDDQFASRSYAGSGEDIFVISWLNHCGVDLAKVRYLDIGAAHPINLSNTYLLYQRGASGVLAEPDPDQAAELRHARLRDRVVVGGAAFDDRVSAQLIRMSGRVFNTFSQAQADHVVTSSNGWGEENKQSVVDKIDVPMFQINDLMAMMDTTPHFVSIDAESKDFDIIKRLDFSRYRPLIICFEAMVAFNDLMAFFVPRGYAFASRTPDNIFFVLEPLPGQREQFGSVSYMPPQ